jgi:hypothetical protein
MSLFVEIESHSYFLSTYVQMYKSKPIGIVPDPISDLPCNWSLDQMNLDMADLLNNIHSIQIIVPTKTVPFKSEKTNSKFK